MLLLFEISQGWNFVGFVFTGAASASVVAAACSPIVAGVEAVLTIAAQRAYFADSSEETRVFPSVAECLNAHWFRSFGEAQRIVATCEAKYDVRRPHRALGEKTPNELANKLRVE